MLPPGVNLSKIQRHFLTRCTQISSSSFYHDNIPSILAMTTNTSNTSTAVTAGLVLIPIVIVAGIAFAAIKCTNIWESSSTKFKNWSLPFQKKNTSKIYHLKGTDDSFGDLESLTRFDKFVGQDETPRLNPTTPERVWHPNRSSRLAWSFTNPRSRNPIRYVLGSVQKPDPTAVRRGDCRRMEDV